MLPFQEGYRSRELHVPDDNHRNRYGVGILTLNRSERHNALDRTPVAEMTAELRELEADPRVAVVVRRPRPEFRAGTDPAWVRDTIHGTPEEKPAG